LVSSGLAPVSVWFGVRLSDLCASIGLTTWIKSQVMMPTSFSSQWATISKGRNE
jgi:hypothetical protein